MDDIYEGYDPLAEILKEDGFCDHGIYVGGCGPDYMCGWCESGTSWEEFVAILRIADNRRRRRETRDAYILAVVLAVPVGPGMYSGFYYKTFGAIIRAMT